MDATAGVSLAGAGAGAVATGGAGGAGATSAARAADACARKVRPTSRGLARRISRFFLGFSRIFFESRGSVPEAFGPGKGPSGSSLPPRWERVASRLARVLSSPSESKRAMSCRAGRADGARAAGGGEESKAKSDNPGPDQFHQTQIPAGAKPDLMCGDVFVPAPQAAPDSSLAMRAYSLTTRRRPPGMRSRAISRRHRRQRTT